MIILKKRLFLTTILSLSILMTGCSFSHINEKMQTSLSSKVDIYVSDDVDVFGNKINEDNNFSNIIEESIETESNLIEEPNQNTLSELEVYFIDVGQADSILLKLEDENILIDGGNNSDGDDLVEYLEYLGIEKIDTIIGTHPHEDHIGGLDDVIENIVVDKIYLPYINDADMPTTVTYKDLLLSIKENDVMAIQAKNNDFIYNTNDVKLQILSPSTIEPGDLNDYSIVTKLTYGNKSFLFTGDASTKINDYIINNYPSDFLDVDVLKSGHHGSHTSNNKEWYDITNPEYVVIQCGEGNQYGHPHKETLDLIKDIKTYRTDIDGTILFKTDGNNMAVETKLTGNIPLGEEGFSIN